MTVIKIMIFNYSAVSSQCPLCGNRVFHENTCMMVNTPKTFALAQQKLEHKSTFEVTFGEGGLFSSSEKEKVLSFLFRLSRSWAREWDSSLCVGEDDSDFFSDTSDSSSNSSGCSEVLSSVRDSSSTSSWSSSSSPPLPWGGRGKKKKAMK